ncbi:MAG: hypothetical protein WC408_06260 [Candidatus Micrarchaeia archaeon]|jgi:hypothetical protein
MLLDAQTYEIVLTPEIALSSVQKDLTSSGHKNIEVQQIRLFYEPFWIFTFDVEGAQQPISGKTALNASTGDVNEFVPMLLDRPLNKTKNTAENTECEVEPTSVDRKEVERVAQARVAAQIGVKKDQVSVSAFQKIYVPFYKIWLSVDGTPYKAEVDGCLGATFGLEGVPRKQKGMDEVTKETLEKMKSPSGWLDLMGRTASSVAGGATSKEGPIPGMGKAGLWLILVAIIVVVFLLANPFKSNVTMNCAVDPEFLKTDLDLIVYKFQSINPGYSANNTLYVTGICSYTTKTVDGERVCPKIYINLDGSEINHKIASDMCGTKVVYGNYPTTKEFRIDWEDDGLQHAYELSAKLN